MTTYQQHSSPAPYRPLQPPLPTDPGAGAVRAALPDLGSGWAVAAWFARANVLLAGQRPVDLLDTDLSGVLHAAWPGPDRAAADLA